jgi:hypothetical protein
MSNEYTSYSTRVKQHIAEKMTCQKVLFSLNVDNTACLLVIDEHAHVYCNCLCAALTDAFRFDPKGLAETIIEMVNASRKIC